MSNPKIAAVLIAVVLILGLGLTIRLALVHRFGWYGWFM